MLTSSDMPFPTVTLSTGEEVRLDQAAYSLHRASRNRDDRKLVFDRFWEAWKAYETTLGQTLDTHVKTHVFQAKTRRYASALDAALAGPNIPTAVYHKLIEATHRHLPSLHRYFRLRQRMLGLERSALLRHLPAAGRIPARLRHRRVEGADARLGGAARQPLPGAAREGVRRDLDARVSAAGQGAGRLYVR